ncbi:MAG: histidine kinase [Lachnospiraceae bacterium]|nr:histidine kinase [Lachnospiraceae bacterium]
MIIRVLHIAFEIWGVFLCLFMSVGVSYKRKHRDDFANKMLALLFSNAIILISDVCAWIFRGDTSTLGYYMVRISNFMVFLFSFIFIIAGVNIYNEVLSRRLKRGTLLFAKIEYVLCFLLILLLILSRIFGFYYDFDSGNRYFRTDYFWVQELLSAVCVLIFMITLIRYYKLFAGYERAAVFFSIFVILTAIIIQVFVYGISLINISITIFMVAVYLCYEAKYSMDILEKEKKLNEKRIRLFNNQIQPHFIFNSLLVIEEMCRDNPEAVETIRHFAGFLRNTVDNMSETECIDLKDELELVDNYLYMQKKRFGDTIKDIEEIEDVDFKVPAFTIQVLVENAIRHGIRAKYPPGGTIWIKTYRSGSDHVIEVIDDGVGFDPESIDMDDEVHIGLNNVKTRLEMMCKGSFEIKSSVGAGAGVLIKIPG